jgi:hypothetical protein
VKLELSCCGSPNSCLIDGDGPAERNTPLFSFLKPVNLILQGLSFVNLRSGLVYGVLITTNAASVVAIKHVAVESVTYVSPVYVPCFSHLYFIYGICLSILTPFSAFLF